MLEHTVFCTKGKASTPDVKCGLDKKNNNSEQRVCNFHLMTLLKSAVIKVH